MWSEEEPKQYRIVGLNKLNIYWWSLEWLNTVHMGSLRFLSSVTDFWGKHGAGCKQFASSGQQRQRMSFIWQHRSHLLVLEPIVPMAGVKFCILSQSIPWGFSGPSLLQTVQLVLLTKANVKGHIKLMLAGFDWLGGGPGLLSARQSDRGQRGKTVQVSNGQRAGSRLQI